MSWKDRSGGSRGYHHGNLKEALLRAALELIEKRDPFCCVRIFFASDFFWCALLSTRHILNARNPVMAWRIIAAIRSAKFANSKLAMSKQELAP